MYNKRFAFIIAHFSITVKHIQVSDMSICYLSSYLIEYNYNHRWILTFGIFGDIIILLRMLDKSEFERVIKTE